MLLRAAVVPPAEAVDELWAATRALRQVPGVKSVPRDQLEIPITAFGNLLPPDCARLARLMRTAFEGAEAPVVWFHGLRLEEEATIALGLAGDVEPVADLARFVPEAAENMRLYVDRRRFRPMIQFATAGPHTSPAMLMPALELLLDWTGSPWPLPGMSLIRTRWEHGESRAEEYDRILMA